jgi:Domain of unknown function (DUF4250)
MKDEKGVSMNREILLHGDLNLTLSIVNMKLRDQYRDLEALCEDFNLTCDELTERLISIDYYYNKETNQFIHKEARMD